jgi:RHS repeat-associated protein
MPIRSLWLTPECKQNLQLIDPHGDIVSKITTGTQPTLTAFTAFDEYGNQLTKQNPTNPATASSYGWAGKAEKPTTVSGLILMWARLYNSVTGRFTSRDPVPGGNENAYNYPNDPINGNDWTGCYGWANIIGGLAAFVLTSLACASTALVGCLVAGVVIGAVEGGIVAGIEHAGEKDQGVQMLIGAGIGAIGGLLGDGLGHAVEKTAGTRLIKFVVKSHLNKKLKSTIGKSLNPLKDISIGFGYDISVDAVTHSKESRR